MMSEPTFYERMPTPQGEILLLASAAGLRGAYFHDQRVVPQAENSWIHDRARLRADVSELRAYFDRLIDESLARYDIDGLELDFLREPYLFSRGEEDAGRAVLTEWISAHLARVDDAAPRRHQRRLSHRSAAPRDHAVEILVAE